MAVEKTVECPGDSSAGCPAVLHQPVPDRIVHERSMVRVGPRTPFADQLVGRIVRPCRPVAARLQHARPVASIIALVFEAGLKAANRWILSRPRTSIAPQRAITRLVAGERDPRAVWVQPTHLPIDGAA